MNAKGRLPIRPLIREWWRSEKPGSSSPNRGSAVARKAAALPARLDLVLRFGREIAGVMALAQLFFGLPTDAVDHAPALDGRALADFFRPAREVLIFVRLQELAGV